MTLRLHFVLALVTLIFSVNSWADFQVYRIAPCSFWMPDRTGGFVCQNIPPSILVPEAESVTEVLREQSRRISDLEKKIGDLETSCQKP